MRFRRRRFGRRRRYYRKRRGGWRRRYGRRWRRTAWRRRRVRRWRRSVFRRGGRRARPYRITAWNPRVVRRVVIKGWWPLIQCMQGMEYLRYRPMNNIEKRWIYKKSNSRQFAEDMGYLMQYGGGWASGTISLKGLFNEHQLWRNVWSRSNDGMDLARYFGCSISLYPEENQDYLFWFDTEFDETQLLNLQEYTQPSVMLQAKNSRLIVAKSRMPIRRRIKKIFIPPPAQMTTQWQFQKDLADYPLFNWACICIDMEKPFDYTGAWRNAWWLMQRQASGDMEYIEKWGRIPPTGDFKLPSKSSMQGNQDNPNWHPNDGPFIYPIVAYWVTEEGKNVLYWCTIHNAPINRWRKREAMAIQVRDLRGLCLRVCSAQETYYRWQRAEFTDAFKQRWFPQNGTDHSLVVIDATGTRAQGNPDVWNFLWNSSINTQTTPVLKYWGIDTGNQTRQWQDTDFAKLQLPKTAHDIDFGHKTRFGPFCVKNPPCEFRETPPQPINIWVKYKFFFQFGGMYQPPCGIQDPGTSNPTYPVRMGGAVTHPKYAGQGGGYTTEIGHQGITAASLRAISAAPPRTYSQSAFLQEPKEETEAREETEETTSESSITSAESSSERDGSSENEERRERRRRNKRRLRIFLQRLADRSLDHKRRRFSE
uniref:Capsid protein n=1 Tax=Torque teno sus virus 1a TaxID=687386 RepID=A0A344X421_9VIRU|nr:ORF1 [Torque teno sus virus 1a]